jgi:hypothetical protein
LRGAQGGLRAERWTHTCSVNVTVLPFSYSTTAGANGGTADCNGNQHMFRIQKEIVAALRITLHSSSTCSSGVFPRGKVDSVRKNGAVFMLHVSNLPE